MEKLSMWLSRYQFAGYDLYHLVACFFLFSIIGWMVESIYISFCNRKLTNRGFMTGPFCPIYGVGATLGYIILHPFANNIVALYIVGALLATLFEFLVAKLMIRLFGEVWWDYNDKFCNYKGVICLESTLAWGLYAVIIITFLFEKVISFVDRYPKAWGLKTIALIFAMAIIDFGYHFAMSVKIDEEMREDIIEKKDEFVDFCHRLIGR
ncbi:MAG: putative ABC transporter permease [Lachnospiraceae bacterium]|nr:putative ABC transporter permease [Lachnospiraceae bacterium]MDE7002448.1 putative ABC transporter permease [Lachnospiraceae bacterium]